MLTRIFGRKVKQQWKGEGNMVKGFIIAAFQQILFFDKIEECRAGNVARMRKIIMLSKSRMTYALLGIIILKCIMMKLDARVASAGVGHGAAEDASERNYKISGLVKARRIWTSGETLLL